MEQHGTGFSPIGNSIFTAGTKAFSKTIAATYVGVGFFALAFLIGSIRVALQPTAYGILLQTIGSLLSFSLAIGLTWAIWAIHQRRNWARYVAVAFWLLCLIWSVAAIARNGFNPPAPRGPFEYSNRDQLAGARFSALVLPFFMVAVGSAAVYCLLRKANIVSQFRSLAKAG